MRYHLAQLNIARLAESLDHPSMSEFVALLEPVNAAADDSPGFVWRLPTEEGNATSIRAFDGEAMLVNLTVWESLDALYAFTYRGDHLGPLRRRREWFKPTGSAAVVLWWVPAGHIPTIEEARTRLAHLTEHGPTPEAFTFRHSFEQPK
jgi:hypothetical protein